MSSNLTYVCPAMFIFGLSLSLISMICLYLFFCSLKGISLITSIMLQYYLKHDTISTMLKQLKWSIDLYIGTCILYRLVSKRYYYNFVLDHVPKYVKHSTDFNLTA